MASEKFNIVVSAEKLPAVKDMARAILEFRGIVQLEAVRESSRSFGLIGENLQEEQAARLLDICSRTGIPVMKIPVSKMPVLNSPITINKITFENEKINYRNKDISSSESIRNLIVVAYAPIKYSVSKTVTTKDGPSVGEKAVRLGMMMITGLPVGLGKSKEVSKEIKDIEVKPYLDLIFSGDLHLRLNSDDLDFSCLKEKKTYSSHVNLRLLCLEMVKMCPSALKNTALFDILENKTSPTLQYESVTDMEKEMTRLLALKSVR